MAEIIQFPGSIQPGDNLPSRDHASDQPDEPEIIQFPEAEEPLTPPLPPAIPPADPLPEGAILATPEQLEWLDKLNSIAAAVLRGEMAMVVLAIRPAGNGADFLHVVAGPEQILRPSAPYLDATLAKALQRRGLL